MFAGHLAGMEHARAQLEQIGDHHREVDLGLVRLVDIANGARERLRIKNPAEDRLRKLPTVAAGIRQVQPALDQFVGRATARDGPAVHCADGSSHHQLGLEHISQRFPGSGLVSTVHPSGGQDQAVQGARVWTI